MTVHDRNLAAAELERLVDQAGALAVAIAARSAASLAAAATELDAAVDMLRRDPVRARTKLRLVVAKMQLLAKATGARP